MIDSAMEFSWAMKYPFLYVIIKVAQPALVALILGGVLKTIMGRK